MDRNKPDAATLPNDTEAPPARPTWQPTRPGEMPPRETVDAMVAQNAQRLEQIQDPNLRLLIDDLMLALRDQDETNRLACFLTQTNALMNFANSIPLVRELDLVKPIRDGLIAQQDYNAGSDAKLSALRGKKPNKTKAKRPSAARERALIRLFVYVLTMNGGLGEIDAEKKVAKLVTRHGLKRCRLGVHGVCVDIDMAADDLGDKTGAAEYEPLKARLPAGIHQWSDEKRLDWVERAAPIIAKLQI